MLEKLGSMHVRARTLVEGILAGMHRSPHRGGSVEFAEYIEYSAGQELKHVDWKVFAKSDKYYVKQYEDETNLRAYLIIDGSGSMNFQSEEAPLTKLRYVSYLAAAFAYLFMRQGDAVGALSFDESARDFLPASSKSSHLDDLFHLLEKLRGDGSTDLVGALRTVAERAKGRSLILIFSDLLDADQEVMSFLRVLRQRRNDVVLFHVLDSAEVELPYEGLSLFEGLEDEGKLLVDPDDLRERYLVAMREHLAWLQAQSEEGDLGYFRFLTSEPLEEVCLRFLRRRR
ncbi:MAG: DUF58 domain-containing protein [Bradymonadaceae bacterium]|nr:DUF58 domain-containing protein [Lujinxingiaceae bacterium]